MERSSFSSEHLNLIKNELFQNIAELNGLNINSQLKHQHRLSHDLNIDEISDYQKKIEDEKSPSPNGFSIIFFQAFWELIKGALMAFIKYFWTNGQSCKALNFSYIFFIPKIAGAEKVGDFHAIGLTNGVMKIMEVHSAH